jgi:PleD family two-component response regulator
MQKHGTKTILAVMSDLFFSVKISDAAKRVGMTVEFVKDAAEVLTKAKNLPTLIIFDLNYEHVDPLKLITKLKATPELKRISVIGFVSHVQGELKQAAHDTGCDMVLARSAFSQNLPQILKRHSGSV